jgi:hypothetical protein
MSTAREAAERTAQIASHIVEQEDRVDRQVSLIAELERVGHTAMLKDAQRLLGEMIVLLAKMHDELLQAPERVNPHSPFQRILIGTR